MAKKGTPVFLSTLFFLALLKGNDGDLQAYGCDEDWTNHEEHCYHVTVVNGNASVAREGCQMYGGHLASVWTPEEKDVILSMWRFPSSEMGFIWLGLQGTVDGSWEYNDGSATEFYIEEQKIMWSLLDEAPGTPVSSVDKCVALTNNGALAFLDCGMQAHAFACKKALPKVYVTSHLLNHTSPSPVSPLSQVQMFERLYPPVLTELPSLTHQLAEVKVPTEVSCAYKCFSVTACLVFQVWCEVSDNCASFRCLLFPGYALTF